MGISYKIGLKVSCKSLNSLFESIGWKPRTAKKWREVLSKSYFMCTAWDRKRLVGMGRIMEDGVMCMFYDICIHPDYQRKGIGTKVIQKMIGKVKTGNYASIGIFAWKENPSNIPFYEKRGFVRKESGMELDKYMVPE